MARHLVSSPEVRPLVDDLVSLVLAEGSVSAAQRRLVSTLAEDKSEGWLYPNRLHTLLSSEGSRAVNSETLDVLRLALDRLPSGAAGPEAARERSGALRSKALHAAEVASAAAGESPSLQAVAAEVDLPPAVVLRLLEEADAGLPVAVEEGGARPPAGQPDWSFQDVAHQRCLEALGRDGNRKVGLVLPTGAGKTRVAIRIGLSALARSGREDSVLLWVTHRSRLRTQAHRELQRALTGETPGLPEDATELLSERVRFCMVSELGDQLAELADRVALVIVDEAHHAAAPSYQPIFDHRPLRGLFLTATPNRTDLLPIGIDEIAYTITTRELFDRGVIVRPTLEKLVLDRFDWESEEERRNLADVLLDRAQGEFVKTLVAVSRTEFAEALHGSLLEVFDEYEGHVLEPDDLGFVHGSATSTGEPADVFLDEFAARPRGILVATSQLLGEGFDDPSVNTVVVTYPTSSMVALMQVAGRCLRWTPEKRNAFVVQVKDSPLAYHWEQRWLYQDISDLLRPQLADCDYATLADLDAQVGQVLEGANVTEETARTVRRSLAEVEPGEDVSLLLTGLPYDGPAERFAEEARWSAVLVTPRERESFLRVFNDFSGRGASVNDYGDFLRNYLTPDPAPGSRWKSYVDMLHAMAYARREIDGEEYDGARHRQFVPSLGTTWLRYISFQHRPAVPVELERFLADSVNGEEVLARYAESPDRHALAVKIPLPLAGTLAYLLDGRGREWLLGQRDELRAQLREVDPRSSFESVPRWSRGLTSAPIPPLLIERFEWLLREEEFARLSLDLAADGDGGPA